MWSKNIVEEIISFCRKWREKFTWWSKENFGTTSQLRLEANHALNQLLLERRGLLEDLWFNMDKIEMDLQLEVENWREICKLDILHFILTSNFPKYRQSSVVCGLIFCILFNSILKLSWKDWWWVERNSGNQTWKRRGETSLPFY